MINIDQEFRDLIPPLTGDEFNQLEKNILADGCREAVLLWNDIIIDGHNRYEICTKNNLEFRTYKKEFANRSEVVQWIILNQFGRRNLSPYSRSVLALRYESEIKEKGIENKRKAAINTNSLSTNLPEAIEPIDTRREIALKANVSQGTIQMVKKIQEKASEEVKEKLKSGEMTINGAYVVVGKEEKRKSITSISDHFASHSLDRRISFYPNLLHFKLHIAHSFDQQTGKGKVADIIVRGYYDGMPEEKKTKLLALFETMTLDQIERTNDSRG